MSRRSLHGSAAPKLAAVVTGQYCPVTSAPRCAWLALLGLRESLKESHRTGAAFVRSIGGGYLQIGACAKGVLCPSPLASASRTSENPSGAVCRCWGGRSVKKLSKTKALACHTTQYTPSYRTRKLTRLQRRISACKYVSIGAQTSVVDTSRAVQQWCPTGNERTRQSILAHRASVTAIRTASSLCVSHTRFAGRFSFATLGASFEAISCVAGGCTRLCTLTSVARHHRE
jgi:hypothetical protein